MKINNNYIPFVLIYLFFCATLFIGFYFSENSSGGAIFDFNIHLRTVNYFNDGIYEGLLNYDKYKNSHSPIFIIFLKYLISYNLNLGISLYIIICSTVPLIFYFAFKEKFKSQKLLIVFYLSQFFILSPYFRSSAIWPSDENVSILFLLISIFYYIKFCNSAQKNNKYKYIFLNIIFLALASYFRPIYSLFSILFFWELVIKNFNIKKFIFYIILSFLISFPAIYYVFIMKVNFFYPYISAYKPINSLILSYSVFMFYLFPFIVLSKQKIEWSNINFIFSIIFLILSVLFFSYTHNLNGIEKQLSSGGGIFYVANKIVFGNDLYLIIFSTISFYICNNFLEIKKIKNLLILILLIFFEIDTFFYQETYDPLFLICLFFLFDTKLIKNFIQNLSFIKINFIFLYLFMFWLIKMGYFDFLILG